MNNLYKYLVPFLADTFGFQEVVDVTDGMGILDDCSPYKGQVSRTDTAEPYSGLRMVSSWIRMEDVIGGTKAKLLETFRKSFREFDPAFVLIGTAPVASMIGTDLEDVADSITRESGIPAAAVELNGHKYYDQGISASLLALAKLLVRPAEEKIPGGVNLIGGNAIDWTARNVRGVRAWAEENGFWVVSQWGGRETAENLRQAARAEINLVTAAAGLATAQWMEREFDIPYISAAPFGRGWAARVAAALKSGTQPELPQSGEPARVLIVGEQLTSNAIRATLELDYGMGGVDVATFFTFSKALARPGDKRVKGEDALKKLMGGGYDFIIADPDLRVLAPETCRWIDLPHGAVCFENTGDPVPLLTGENLNRWLDRVLPGKDGTR
ncbi:MAG: nitrogenase component 1 [Oscillospiraceae bacterium]